LFLENQKGISLLYLHKMAVLRSSLIVSALALLFSASTEAHVSMNPKFGEPGQVLNTAFRVPHGCNGSSTTAILITVPETVTTIVPKDVANWVRYDSKRLFITDTNYLYV
jgi:uncharacterized protein YcnI